MKIGAIILARLDSSRLPGKALRTVEGKPLFQYVVELCQAVESIDQVVLATSDRHVDDPLVGCAEKLGLSVFRGELDNVARRFLKAMRRFSFDAALRVNGDSPLNRASLLAEGVRLFKQNNVDIVSNVAKRTYPFGVSLEVVSVGAMERVVKDAQKPEEYEHVTKFIYDHRDQFHIESLERSDMDYQGIQLAVDTDIDLVRFESVIRQAGGDLIEMPLEKIVALHKQAASTEDIV